MTLPEWGDGGLQPGRYARAPSASAVAAGTRPGVIRMAVTEVDLNLSLAYSTQTVIM